MPTFIVSYMIEEEEEDNDDDTEQNLTHVLSSTFVPQMFPSASINLLKLSKTGNYMQHNSCLMPHHNLITIL